MSNEYARAIFNFASAEPGDLPLSVGDVVRIEKKEGKEWLRGSLLAHPDQQGIFPANHVDLLTLPDAGPGDSLFVAVESFKSTKKGDLSFMKGDVVVGTREVKDGWWHGRIGHEEGVFPYAYVCVLASGKVAAQHLEAESRAIMDVKGQIDGELSFNFGEKIRITKVLDDVFCEGWCGQEYGMFSVHAVEVLEPETFSRMVSAAGVALPEVTVVTRRHDNGVREEVPLSINERNRLRLSSIASGDGEIEAENGESESETRSRTFTSENTSSAEDRVEAYAKAVVPFIGQNSDELTFMAGDIVKLLGHVDKEWTYGEVTGPHGTLWQGIFPTRFVEIVVDCDILAAVPLDGQGDSTPGGAPMARQSTPSPMLEPNTSAVVLYDFPGEQVGDLRVRAGDHVTVLTKVDANWVEAASLDGRVGQLPVAFVEIGATAPTPTPTHVVEMVQETKPLPPPRKNSPAPSTYISPSPPAGEPPVQERRDVFARNWTKNASLDDAISNELESAKRDAWSRSSSVLSKASTPPNNRPLSCYVTNDFASSERPCLPPKLSMKKQPPPRPVGPRLAPAPSKTPLEPAKASPPALPPRADKKPVPSRPAPPRPVPFLPSPKSPGIGDFDSLAPLRGAVTLPRSENGEDVDGKRVSSDTPGVLDPDVSRDLRNSNAVGDLQRRIEEIQSNIKRFEDDADSIRRSVAATVDGSGPPVSESERREKRETLQFCQDNILGLGEELEHLSGVLVQFTGESNEDKESKPDDAALEEQAKEKRARQKTNVLNELVSTEKTYFLDLQAVIDSFDKHIMTSKIRDADQECLFGNIEDIAGLSERFIQLLEETIAEDGLDNANISECFLTLRDEFERVYVEYCISHESAIKLFAKVNERPDLEAYVTEGMTRLREKGVNAMDLETLLIKPVQRLLKYPLLLNTLLSSTECDSPLRSKLVEAISEMTNVASAINEQKLRKDLTAKYLLGVTEESGSKGLSKSYHSLKKFTGRFAQNFYNKTLGRKSVTVDNDFDGEHTRFLHLRKNVKVVIRTVRIYRDTIRDMLDRQANLATSITDVICDKASSLGQEAEQYRLACDEAAETYREKYLLLLESRVTGPLEKLLSLFQGPFKLINKRQDKLLDYNKMELTMKKAREGGNVTRGLEDELEQARKIYQAMNDQLKEELPRLNRLVARLLNECIANYVHLMRNFADSGLQQLGHLLPLLMSAAASPVSPTESPGLTSSLDHCMLEHTRLLDELSGLGLMPRPALASVDQTRTRVDSSSQDRQCRQSEEQRSDLQQKYSADKLYVAVSCYKAFQPLELDITTGDLVGVIKTSDPTGNQHRWLVDMGNKEMGFVPDYTLKLASSTDTDTLFPANDPGTLSNTRWFVDIGAMAWLQQQEESVNKRMNAPQRPPPSTKARSQGHRSSVTTISKPEVVPFPQKRHSMAVHNMPSQYQTTNVTPPKLAMPPPYMVRRSMAMSTCRALHNFTARNPNELTISSGETLTLLQKHDHSNNPEWWLVSGGGGRQGYVPHNYVQIIS